MWNDSPVRTPSANCPIAEAREVWRTWNPLEQILVGFALLTLFAIGGIIGIGTDPRGAVALIVTIALLGAGVSLAIAKKKRDADETWWPWLFMASFHVVIVLKAVLTHTNDPVTVQGTTFSLGLGIALFSTKAAGQLGICGWRNLRRSGGAVFDALIAACSISVAVWYVALAPLAKGVSLPTFLFDGPLSLSRTLLIFVPLLLLYAQEESPRLRQLGALSALAAIAASASTVSLTQAYLMNAPLPASGYAGWAIAGGLELGAVLLQLVPTSQAVRPARWEEGLARIGRAARAYGHYAAALVAMGEIVLYDAFELQRFAFLEHPEVTVLALLFFVRQATVIRENSNLARRIDAANGALHSLVEHLRALNALTNEVNGELAARPMLEAAATHLSEVLEADAVYVSRERSGRVEVFDTRKELEADIAALIRQGRNQRNLPIQLTQTDATGLPNYAAITGIYWDEGLAGRIIVARRGRPFEASEISLLATVAEVVAKALQNATQHERALDAADRDPVTGLLNHRAFHQRLSVALDRARTDGTTLSLAMIDMNNFKLFNDTYGHLAGDQVLRQVAEALSIETPQGGHLARYGGDEYAAALPGCGEGEMVELAERARERLLSIGFVDPNGTKVPIELSFGIAGFPSDATFRHDLINIADQNLYEAKTSGGGIRWASDHERQNRALRAHASFETLDALVSAVDNKDRYTRKHSEDVTEYALWIADALGYSEDAKRTIRRAGLLHDVGKIGVPDSILRKPGQLSAEEFEIVQRHPRLGELIVSAIPGMEDIVDAVRSHHERYDGGGYPDRLAGETIPVIGRLLAVADAFSAMTTDRPYRKGMAMGEASARLLAGIGSQFDPEMAQCFLDCLRARQEEDDRPLRRAA